MKITMQKVQEKLSPWHVYAGGQLMSYWNTKKKAQKEVKRLKRKYK